MTVSYEGATKFIYVMDKTNDTTPDESSSQVVEATNRANVNLGGKSDGIYWFHVRARTASGLTDTSHWEIRVDNSSPPRLQSAEGIPQADGTVLLKWEPPGEDLSGIVGYDIYRSPFRTVTERESGIVREFSLKDKGVEKIASVITATSFTDSTIAVGKGRPYFYKIRAVDNAGNAGVTTSAITVRTLSLCNLKISVSTSISDQNLSINVSSDGEFDKGRLIVTGPSMAPATLVEKASNTRMVRSGYDLSGKPNGDYNIFFVGYDNESDECFGQSTFIFDTVKPIVNIEAPPKSQILANVIRFVVKAEDVGGNPSGISKVSLFVGSGEEKPIGDANLSGGTYSIDWNSVNAENGRTQIIARAFDRAGNMVEDVVTYSIHNTALQKDSASRAINAAEEKRKQAIEYVRVLKRGNVLVPDANTIFSAGDANLAYAKALLKKGEFLEISKESADDAGELYASIKSKVTKELYGTSAYSYNEAQLEVFLKSSGIAKAQVPESMRLIKKFSPSRRMDVLKVTRDGNSHYLANIVLSLTVPDKNSAVMSVVEVIPKKFADDSKRIFSGTLFEVLESDPVIVFSGIVVDGNGLADANNPIDANSAMKVEIVYSLRQELSKVQADALLASDVMDSFISPPILLPASERISYSSPFDLPKITLPKVDLGGRTTLLIIAIILVVIFVLFCMAVVAAVAVWYLFFRKK